MSQQFQLRPQSLLARSLPAVQMRHPGLCCPTLRAHDRPQCAGGSPTCFRFGEKIIGIADSWGKVPGIALYEGGACSSSAYSVWSNSFRAANGIRGLANTGCTRAQGPIVPSFQSAIEVRSCQFRVLETMEADTRRTLLPPPPRVKVPEPFSQRIDHPESQPKRPPPLLALLHKHARLAGQPRPLDREALDPGMQVLAQGPEEEELPLAEQEQPREGEGGSNGRGEVLQEAEGEPHEAGKEGEVEGEERESGDRGDGQDRDARQEAVRQLGLGDLVVGTAQGPVNLRTLRQPGRVERTHSKTGPFRIKRSLLRFAMNKIGSQSTRPGRETIKSSSEPPTRTRSRFKMTVR